MKTELLIVHVLPSLLKALLSMQNKISVTALQGTLESNGDRSATWTRIRRRQYSAALGHSAVRCVNDLNVNVLKTSVHLAVCQWRSRPRWFPAHSITAIPVNEHSASAWNPCISPDAWSTHDKPVTKLHKRLIFSQQRWTRSFANIQNLEVSAL